MRRLQETCALMRWPERRAVALADLAEVPAAGLEGVASDVVLETASWGFELEEVP